MVRCCELRPDPSIVIDCAFFRYPYMVRFAVILALCSPIFAQTLQIVPSMAPRGGTGSLLITFASPTGKAPVALQWKIAFGNGVTAAAGNLAAGEAAGAAGKVLACAPAKDGGPDGSTYNCILSGGKKAIPNGTILLVKYGVSSQAGLHTVAVRVSDGIAVSDEANQLRKTPLTPVEGTITIR